MKCKYCKSNNVIKAGMVKTKQRFKCKDCLVYFTDTPPRGKPKAMKDLAILMYVKANASYGMIGRILGVSNVAVYKWIKKEAINLNNSLNIKEISDIQIDEMWHYVNGKKNKLWIWKAYDVVSKRTIKWVLGNRDDSKRINR